MRGWIFGLSAVVGGAAMVAACGAGSDCDFGLCGGPKAGVDGGGDGGVPTDPCLETPTEPRCLDDATALFVSAATGSDLGATGAKDRPFKTIGVALARITAKKRRIYVCEGTYAEDIALSAVHARLSLFGGVSCAWAAALDAKPVIGASANPFKVDGVSALAIADVAIEAKDATEGSSVAMFVTTSEITLKRVRVSAGGGANGVAGVLNPLTLPTDIAAASDASAKIVDCPGGAQSKGGKGGANGFDGDPGAPGTDNRGTITMCIANTGGGEGLAGAPPAAAAGAGRYGELTANGWQPQQGADGLIGSPGQGGGGGAGLGGGTGGGGGAGGCGGAGGGGGKGGGASVAVAANQSNLKILDSALESRKAGNGAPGAAGQAGKAPGGTGGLRIGGTACNGGNGGAGATGAPGGGGAGGASAAVLYTGAAPQLDEATTRQLRIGQKGDPGAGIAANPGIDGVALPTLEIK